MTEVSLAIGRCLQQQKSCAENAATQETANAIMKDLLILRDLIANDIDYKRSAIARLTERKNKLQEIADSALKSEIVNGIDETIAKCEEALRNLAYYADQVFEVIVSLGLRSSTLRMGEGE